jgi:23S rRNA pseudouridine2604 synthase
MIRRMCSALGYRVQHLKRVRIMNVTLGRLKSGEWRYLTAAELEGLLPQGLAARGQSH